MEASVVNMHVYTIRQKLNVYDIHWKFVIWKVLLSSKNEAGRLKFAREQWFSVIPYSVPMSQR